jgi:uncharacterized protein YbaP (TraB family)
MYCRLPRLVSAKAFDCLGRQIVAAVLLLAAAAVFTSPAPWAAEAPENGHGLLWRAERPGAKVVPSYLFGTMHVTDNRVRNIAKPVREAFKRSRLILFEVVPTLKSDAMRSQAVFLRPDQKLDRIVGPRRWAHVLAVGQRYGIPADYLRDLKPWVVFAAFSYPPHEVARAAAGHKHLDEWLRYQAQRLGKPVGELESVAEQIALFDSVSLADQITLLDMAIADNAEIEAIFDRNVDLYVKRDIAAMYRTMLTASGENARMGKLFQRRFLDTRNKLMVKRMGRHLKKGGAFVAVGALHLPGKVGLVNLLVVQGYRMTRVY